MPEIAGYRLGNLLGKGNFGETYEAYRQGQRFALKLIKEEAVQAGFDARRFQREVRALQKAAGPNVVRFIDAGTESVGRETRYYVVMEYLEGQSLASAFKAAGQRLDEPTIKSVLVGIIDGLNTVHSQNIVHRDLKPPNVFLTEAGTVKLLDFGLVRMLDYTTLTVVPGQPIGTPLYIAPEVLRGERIDHRADFYSLGVLIYHLVTRGKYPFDAATPLELYAKVVNEPPVRPMRYNNSLASEFEDLILVLLSKQPYERTFDHHELRYAIQSTPISVAATSRRHPEAVRPARQKTWYFRLLHNEKSELRRFVESGGRVDAIEYQASYLPRYRNSLEAFNKLGVKYVLDPVTYRLAYSTYSQTEGLVNLPYVPDPSSVLTPQSLSSIQALQTYAQDCIDWQLQSRASALMAPFHFCRDLGSEWIDMDIKLVEESIAYARGLGCQLPLYAGLCLSIEPYTAKQNQMALLNRYSRARAAGYMFYVDNVDERTNNPLQLRALLDLLLLFQQLGKPVFACRVGTLGLALLAAGADGATSGIASLSSFSESNLLANRQVGYDMEKKYYVPRMMLTLPVTMAEDILSDARNAFLRCNCPFCQGGYRGLGGNAKLHFLHTRTGELAELNALPDTPQRLDWFLGRTTEAIRACEQVRNRQTIALRQGHYSHLAVWRQVFNRVRGTA